ncbi:MAG: carboxylesterase [Firmicutes bacterium HGW-Firmicutes-10]|jgi:phospholipase/carboxylesterase|nr:MAG: carboxylesterase [Firmicutes bacterium HGW-Firmicutes-10]
MIHIYKEKNKKGKTLLLLHGTGGDEKDLLPIADIIDPDANILSVRGQVLEGGSNRFFKRLAMGVFDLEDLVFRTKRLKEFVDWAADHYDFDRNQVIAVGYSNGANIAASMLFHYKDALQRAILYHPMVPINKELPDLTGVKVLICAGENDPICPPQQAQQLYDMLFMAKADVTLLWQPGGHRLTMEEIVESKSWYEKK